MARSDSLIGTVVGKPGTLPEISFNTKIATSLFDSTVGITDGTKVLPIQKGESLRLNIGTAPILAKVTQVKSEQMEVEFRRPICLFNEGNVAISRRIADRWRLIGAGIIG